MRPLTLYAATDDAIAKLDWRGGEAASTTTTLSLNGSGAQCVAVDPHDPRRLFAGTFDHGVFRSDDGGATWIGASANLPHQRVSAIAISPYEQAGGQSVVYFGTEPSNLYRSDDNGRTWQVFPSLLQVPSQPAWSFPPRPWTSHVRWIALHPADPATIYLGIELGGVIRTRDGGQTWDDHKPSAQADAHALATHPAAPDRVYEAAGGGVARSDDAGESWLRLDDGMDRHYTWGLAVDSTDPDLWYVSAARGPRQTHSRDGSAAAVLYHKQGPAAWQSLGQPDRGPLALPNPVTPYALVTPQGTPGGLVAGLHTGDLIVTDDAGDSWRGVSTGLSRILALAEAAA